MNNKKKPERDQYELELATMRQCRRLIMRLSPHARERVNAYLQGATKDGPGDPAPEPQAELFE